MVTHMLTGMLLSTLLITGIPTTPTSTSPKVKPEVISEVSNEEEITVNENIVRYKSPAITKPGTTKETESTKAATDSSASKKETEGSVSGRSDTKTPATYEAKRSTKGASETEKSSGSEKKKKTQDFPEITEKVINKTITYSYVPAEDTSDIEHSDTYKYVQGTCIWKGEVIDHSGGINKGPNGDETYYNLDMSGVVDIMRKMGNTDPYWVRSDGVHMLGNYVMIASDLHLRPRGTIYETSRGMSMVCDTGSFAEDNPMQTDIAVTW